MVEQVFCLIKPDIYKRNKIGCILSILESNDFIIKRLYSCLLTYQEAYQYYELYKNQDFFNDLLKYITSGKCIAVLLEKENAVNDLKKLVVYIREKYGIDNMRNAIDSSDSKKDAIREIKLFFNEAW